jgi:hypothetical protein
LVLDTDDIEACFDWVVEHGASLAACRQSLRLVHELPAYRLSPYQCRVMGLLAQSADVPVVVEVGPDLCVFGADGYTSASSMHPPATHERYAVWARCPALSREGMAWHRCEPFRAEFVRVILDWNAVDGWPRPPFTADVASGIASLISQYLYSDVPGELAISPAFGYVTLPNGFFGSRVDLQPMAMYRHGIRRALDRSTALIREGLAPVLAGAIPPAVLQPAPPWLARAAYGVQGALAAGGNVRVYDEDGGLLAEISMEEARRLGLLLPPEPKRRRR